MSRSCTSRYPKISPSHAPLRLSPPTVRVLNEEGEFLEFDELKEDKEVIKLMEHTIEAEKLFLVSPAYPLSPGLRSSELTSLIVSFLQSLFEQMKAKNNFLRKVIPLARSAWTLAQ